MGVDRLSFYAFSINVNIEVQGSPRSNTAESAVTAPQQAT